MFDGDSCSRKQKEYQSVELLLQGPPGYGKYEKALGVENITTFIPALNTLWGLGSLFEHQADYAKARIMY